MDISATPKVSVITCFLNADQYLEEAVESVLRQDYAHWELLLIDDGSTDNSTRIAKKYAAEYPDKIRFGEHEGHLNKGLSASRNLGISRATGQLIALLDADDVWLPGKLSSQVAIFQQHPSVAMVAEASRYWYSWNDTQRQDVVIAVGALPDQAYPPGRLIHQLYPLGKGAAPCPSGLMIKKAAISRSGRFEESFIKEFSLYEDQAFLVKMYLQEEVYVSAACNNLYRQRPDSIVQSVRGEGNYHAVRKYFLEWLEAYLQAQAPGNETLKRRLRKALLPYRHPVRHLYLVTIPLKVIQRLRKLI